MTAPATPSSSVRAVSYTHLDVYKRQAYAYNEDDPFVVEVATACRKAGLNPTLTASGGGSDANNFNSNGVKSLVLGTGMAKVHTIDEEISIRNLESTAALVLALATS